MVQVSCKRCKGHVVSCVQDFLLAVQESCIITCKLLAGILHHYVQVSCTCEYSCKIFACKIFKALQESGQVTCETARFLQVLQDHLQQYLFSSIKNCSKILQDIFISYSALTVCEARSLLTRAGRY